eukprot:4148260-Prymnesium_polylepis.1
MPPPFHLARVQRVYYKLASSAWTAARRCCSSATRASSDPAACAAARSGPSRFNVCVAHALARSVRDRGLGITARFWVRIEAGHLHADGNAVGERHERGEHAWIGSEQSIESAHRWERTVLQDLCARRHIRRAHSHVTCTDVTSASTSTSTSTRVCACQVCVLPV